MKNASIPWRGMIRLTATAVSNALVLAHVMGAQGCIENPGPDARLNQVSYEYRPLASAEFNHQSILQISLMQDTAATWLRVTSLATVKIDSAAVFIQIGDPFSVQGNGMNFPDPRFRHIARFGPLKPGESLDLGRIAEKELDLTGSVSSLTLLRLSAGSKRSHPLGGVYAGTYNLIDSARTLYAGTLNGIINAEGEFGFILAPDPVRGVNGVLDGLLDQMALDMGTLYTEPAGLRTSPQFERSGTPFLIRSGENGSTNLTGSFHPLDKKEWMQSLDCELQALDLIPY